MAMAEQSFSVAGTSSTAATAHKTKVEPDVIIVLLAAEKKGIFLKHSEYEVRSKRYSTKVLRRYNDFVTLHSVLVTRSPYRNLPRLPPKQLMLDHLLEERRRGLQRWLRIVSKHPVFGNDVALVQFITDETADHQKTLLERLNSDLDEFTRLPEDFELPKEDQSVLAASRETMRMMLTVISKVKLLIEAQAERMKAQGKDIEDLAQLVRMVGNCEIFHDSGFTDMADAFKDVASLSEHCSVQQTNSVHERLTSMIDVLLGYHDLCDRVEKGIVNDHQKAMAKIVNLNKQRTKSVIRGSSAEGVVAIQEKEVAATEHLGTLERRSAFSFHCVMQETVLAQEAIKALPSVMLSFSYEQNQGNSKISKVWESIINREADKIK